MQSLCKRKSAVDRLNNADPNPDLASRHGAVAPVAPAVNPSLVMNSWDRLSLHNGALHKLGVTYMSVISSRIQISFYAY